MIVLDSNEALFQFVVAQRKLDKVIGFVPTMGALHNGHLSLVQKSMKQCGITICSIYVNPTQFNDERDLVKYPRNTDIDLKLLQSVNCDAVYLPSDKDIYPNGTTEKFNIDLRGLDKNMEGEHRPGHFNGVVTVVNNLFKLVQPDKAFFGEKDFQQLTIIKRLIDETKNKIEIVGCPIIREANGLAMSSRNELLTKEQRNTAAFLNQTLVELNKNINLIENLSKWTNERFKGRPEIKLDYLEIADETSLQPIDLSSIKPKRAFIAAYINGVRLIDNIALNN